MIKNFKNKVVLITIGFVFGTGFFTMIYFFSLAEKNNIDNTNTIRQVEISSNQDNILENCTVINENVDNANEEENMLFVSCNGFF